MLLARHEVVQNLLSLRIADLLQYHLFRRLCTDAADFQLAQRLLDVVADLAVRILFARFVQQILA
ncbi:hypothetical protein D3C83_260960 [compost metagenome]